MNEITRSVLIGLLTTDSSLTKNERVTLRRLVDGFVEGPSEPTVAPRTATRPIEPTPIVGAAAPAPSPSLEPLQSVLLTQRDAAKILGVSRVTVWRMTCDHVLHPVELLSGTVRYRREEIMKLAASGWQATVKKELCQRPRQGRRGGDSVD